MLGPKENTFKSRLLEKKNYYILNSIGENLKMQ